MHENTHPVSILETERLARGLSRVQVALRAEVNENSLYRWEKGLSYPHSYAVEALCQFYGKSPQELGIVRSHKLIIVKPADTLEAGATLMTDNIRSNLVADLTARLMSLLNAWPRRNYHYEELQEHIDQTVSSYDSVIKHNPDGVITRRNALRSLILLPIDFCGLGIAANVFKAKIPRDTDNILTFCAAGIAACWHFRRGKEFPLAYDALSLYVPVLKAVLTSQPTQAHQKATASLLAQSFMLKGSLAPSIENSMQAVTYHQEAIRYSALAENPTVQALSSRMMATHYMFEDDWTQAFTHAQQAASFVIPSKVDSLIQSFVASGLSICQAANGQIAEAAVSLSQAYKTFDPHVEIPVHVLYNPAILTNCEACTLFHSGHYKEAATAYDHNLTPGDPSEKTSALGKVDAFFERARVEASRDDHTPDMDLCIDLWTQGTKGAIELRSEQEFTWARKDYKLLSAVFRGEQRVKDLRDLLVHW